MHIKVSVLKLFIVVVEAGNIHDAAEKLGRSASAVSTALKLLEQNIGGTLFETDRKNQLTPLGQYLYDMALTQVSGYEKALMNVQAFAKGQLGKIQIASTPSVATSLIPATLNEFIQSYPHVQVELWDMDTRTLTRWVEQGRVDFGIGGIPENTKVRFEPLFKDELVLVYPVHMKSYLPHEPIDLEKILSFPCITNGVIASHKEEAMQAFHEVSQVHVNNTASLLGLVASGVGVTILPQLSVSMGITGVATSKLKLKSRERQIGLISNSTRPHSPVSELFLEYFKREIERQDM